MKEALFTVTVLELFVGGGGRLLEVGPVTVRMILFAACLCVSVMVLARRKRGDSAVVLALCMVVAYLLVHLSALFIGGMKGNALGIMMTEMQQSLYWLVAPFLALMLRSHDMVYRVELVIRVAGVALAFAYLGVVAALALGAIGYSQLYITLSATGEFAFRNENFFFYKGFLYLGIAAIFFLAIPRRSSILWGTLVIVALALTLTRGFVLSTSIAALLMLIVQRRWRFLGVALAVIAVVAFFLWGYMPSKDESLAANREVSNSQRIEDFAFIVSNTKSGTIFFGEGFGTLINERLNVENTFIWAFWRLGLAGVLFWLLPLVLCLSYFGRISRHNPDFRLACAFMFSTVLVYVQTLTNPYLNNPIGLSYVIVAIFSLRTISRARSCRASSQQAKRPPTLPFDVRQAP